MARRRRYQRVLLPGEREGRRSFLKKGLLGGLALALGGGAWLATRGTRTAYGVTGPFQVLSPQEATVVLAVANRLVPERVGFPRPLEVGVPRRVDGILAMAHPATQKEARQLVRLFENALAGFLFETQLRPFTRSSPEEQDERLRGWATSRITLRRSGYRALKRLVYAAYYGSPETYAAVGYPGPPAVTAPPRGAERVERAPPRQEQRVQPRPAPAERAPAPAPPEPAPAGPPPGVQPAPLEPVPTPRAGVALPEETVKP